MSANSTRNGIMGIVVVLLILMVFGAYVTLSSSRGIFPGASEAQMLTQGSCNSPFPQPPANTRTVLKNGTVKITNWLAVLLMPENATGQICIKYTNNLNNLVQSQVNGGVNKVSVRTQANTISEIVSPASMPSISASPSNIYLYLGSSKIVTYTIDSGSNTSGIYSVATLQSCAGTPLAVGYRESELNASSFAYFTQAFFNCPNINLLSTMVGVTNIQIDYLPIHSNYTLHYSFINSSVVSVNPSPDVQNVTFNLDIQTYASPIRVSLDSTDSGLGRLSQDPNLSKLPSNDSCTWYINNNQVLDSPPGSPGSPMWTPLGSPGSGVVTVHAPTISLPAYSVFDYSLSIQLANLSKSYYYILSLGISITAPAGNYSTRQSITPYYPVNIGRSDFGGNASRLLSGSC